MMRIIFIFLIALCCPMVITGQMTHQDSVRLDYLYKDSYANYSTYHGLSILDTLIVESQKFNARNYEASALQLKAGSYINLGMHDRIQELADSAENFGMKNNIKHTYYYIKYILAQSYNYQGKYRLAMNVAMELYDDSNGYENETVEANPTTRAATPLKITNRINSLACLATAEYCMKHWEESIAYQEECIKITDRWPKLLIAERRDAFDGRMLAALKIDDKQRALRYTKEFEDYLEEYKKTKDDFRSEDENYQMYEFYIHDAYTNIYISIGELEKTKPHVAKMKNIVSQIDQAHDNIAGTYFSTLAKYALATQDYAQACVYADSAAYYTHGFDSSAELDALKLKLDANHGMSNFPQDYDIAQEVLALAESMAHETNESNVEEMSTLLGMDKLKIEAQEAKIKQQTWMMGLIAIAILALAGIAILIEVQKKRREQEKQRILSEQNIRLEQEVARQTKELRDMNEEITTQNEILDERNRIISETNREITDSISYAQRIQNALLPDLKPFDNKYGLSGIFTIFHPHDIVSGDFYWAKEHEGRLMIACADCTGHGVPGAFMSMIGTTILNELCAPGIKAEPSQMLTKLDKQIINALSNKNEDNVKDGMDIALISYNPNNLTMEYALARRPIYVVKNGELIEIKGTKRSIGDRDEKSSELPFEGGSMQMQRGDVIYLFSDGIADQFGSADDDHPHGKRLKSIGLRRLLQTVCSMPADQQRDAIERAFEDWKGNCPQTDDVSLIGVII